MNELGPETVVDFARRLGFSSPIPPFLSVALGSAETTLEEITSAYAVFPNRGIRMPPYRITKIVDRTTGTISYGEVPPYSVVVAGSMPGKPMGNGEPGPSLYCAVIVKRVDERTRSKTSLNELLRN